MNASSDRAVAVLDLARSMGGPSQEVISIGRLLRDRLGNFRALDLGSGSGRNTVYLAGLGAFVTAVDSSVTHMNVLNGICDDIGLKVSLFQERAECFSAPHTYDLVLCHGILHFLPAASALEVIAHLKARTAPGGIHIITVCKFGALSQVPRSFTEQGYSLPATQDQWLRAYSDWRCVALERYIKRDHHPGEGYHVHPIEKLVFQQPAITSVRLNAEKHRLTASPRPEVHELLMSDEFVRTHKQDIIAKIGVPDLAFSYEALGPQLSFRQSRVTDHKLQLLFWSNQAGYFENGALVGHSQYESSFFHTFNLEE